MSDMSIIDQVKIKHFRGGDDEIVKPADKGYVNPLKKGTAGYSLYDLWKHKYQPAKEDG